MKTILFPTDFSKNAEHAAQFVGILATNLCARVIILHIDNTKNSPTEKRRESTKTLNKGNNIIEEKMRNFTSKFIEKTHLCHDRITQLISYGADISEKIVEISQTSYAHFIVMGTTGASTLIRKWLGTNAQKVIKNAGCPVWIIPENALIKFPHKIMYAADFKENEILATNHVLQILEPLGVMCKVIHIHDFFGLKAGKKIKEIVKDLREEFKDKKVLIKNINRRDKIEGLESYINIFKPDVLSLAVHEKSIFEKISESSITKYFVQQAKLPLLIFRK
jgi:nucleotide-binding universal stress UspA family protein